MFVPLLLVVALPSDEAAYFETHVRPLLANHCIDCHNADDQQGGVRLDRKLHLLSQENGYAPVVPSDPDASRILQVAAYHDDDIQMPPDGKLDDEALATLRHWIATGAYYPDDEAAEDDTDPWPRKADGSIDFEAAQSAHWAYQPISRPEVPSVPAARMAGGAKTPIDAFIIAKLRDNGLHISPQADRATLLRRLSYDTTGLPPSFEELQDFAADPSDDAYERAVDAVLADPHFGERWARHWLDIARYADTKGYVGGNKSIDYPYAYTYRDWVAGALNDDLPYDQFVSHQLAADLVAPDNPEALAAMGLLNVGNRYINNSFEINNDRIDVITSGFLGMTVACARCHDHKFDPIPQSDYWSMAGVFESSYEPRDPPLVDPDGDLTATAEGRDFKTKRDALQAKVDAMRDEEIATVKADILARMDAYLLNGAMKQTWIGRQTFDPPLHDRAAPVITRWMKSGTASPVANTIFLASIDREKADFVKATLGRQRGVQKNASHPRQPSQYLLNVLVAEQPASFEAFIELIGKRFVAFRERLDAGQSLDPLEQAFVDDFYKDRNPLTVPTEDYHNLLGQKARRRVEKAASEVTTLRLEHPGAPARAMALFDKEKPTNLPVYIRGDRKRPGDRTPRRSPQIIATDATAYPDDTSGRALLAADIASPDNPLTARVAVNRIWQHYFGRGLVATPSDFGTRGEAPSHPELLDYLAGRLIDDGWSTKRIHREILLSNVYRQRSAERSDAAEVDPENILLARQNRRRQAFEPMRDAMLAAAGQLDESIGGPAVSRGQPRRSFYQTINRNDLPGELLTFDFPSPDTTIATRSETTVPQQALYQLNNDQVRKYALAIAQRQPGITPVFRNVLARNPTAEERDRVQDFIRDGGKLYQVAQVLLMSNEFHFVD